MKTLQSGTGLKDKNVLVVGQTRKPADASNPSSQVPQLTKGERVPQCPCSVKPIESEVEKGAVAVGPLPGCKLEKAVAPDSHRQRAGKRRRVTPGD